MNYLSIDSLSKSHGTKTLFEGISFGISKGQRTAIIAKNGTGKSSLLSIIAGLDTADSGTVTLRKEIKVGFLQQNPPLDDALNIMETIYASNDPKLSVLRRYNDQLTLCESDPSEKNLDTLQSLGEEIEHQSAWNLDSTIKEVLSKLGINNVTQPVNTLSGGQRKRLALAQMLIQGPDLLLMDEPTNHLDIEMIEWLEKYLINNDQTLLLVTHDRYFLDNVCNEIVEIENGKLTTYKGNFEYFLDKKSNQEAIENSEIDKAKNLFRKELDWVRRMPKARGTKSKSRLDAFEETKEKAFSKKKADDLQLDVKMNRIGGKILELIKISKSYNDDTLIDKFSYTFKKGDRIGVVGKNGVGKSTFLNIALQQLDPDSGKVQPGETITFGYYKQEGMKVDEGKRVIDIVKDVAEYIPLSDGSKVTPSGLLTRFMFPPNVQHSFVSKLSGGERRRLFLLTVLMKNPNFLVLDEPTNDLDLQTLSILEEFLQNFEGCLLIVSHDRYFMDKLVNHLFVFEGNGIIKDFPGNYTQYRNKPKEKPVTLNVVVGEEKATITTKDKRVGYNEKREYELLEKEIEALEKEKQELNSILETSTDHEEITKASERIGNIITLLETKGDRWLELSELL